MKVQSRFLYKFVPVHPDGKVTESQVAVLVGGKQMRDHVDILSRLQGLQEKDRIKIMNEETKLPLFNIPKLICLTLHFDHARYVIVLLNVHMVRVQKLTYKSKNWYCVIFSWSKNVIWRQPK